MALDDGLLIACKDTTLELTAHVVPPYNDEPEAFRDALVQRVAEHRYLGMTDPSLLDSDELSIASVVESREPLGEELESVLQSIGFLPENTETGGRSGGGFLSRWSRGRRSQLDRWRLEFSRAAAVSEALGTFEKQCISQVPDNPLNDLPGTVQAIQQAVTYAFGLTLAPDLNSLGRLESALGFHARHRLILHPSTVHGLTAFLILILNQELRELTYDPDDDPPVVFPSPLGPTGTDPEARVVDHIMRGNRASLSSYVRGLIEEQQQPSL